MPGPQRGADRVGGGGDYCQDLRGGLIVSIVIVLAGMYRIFLRESGSLFAHTHCIHVHTHTHTHTHTCQEVV